MEIYFSRHAVRDAAEYVARKYPRGKVGIADGCGGLGEALAAVGNTVVDVEKSAPDESVRMFVCFGKEREFRLIRTIAKELPVVAAIDFAYGCAFEDTIISGNLNIKCGYPEAIFYDVSGDCGYLYASAFAGAFGSYAEALNRSCSARRGPNETTARELLKDARDNLFLEISAEDLILRTADIKARLNEGDRGFLRTAAGLYPEEKDTRPLGAYFFLCYIIVFLTIRFTNFGFCSILLGKDEVRARILAEKTGLKRKGGSASGVPNLDSYRTLTARYAPSESDLKAVLDRFLVESGGARASLDMLLNDLVLAADMTEGDSGFAALLARSGFIDALTDETG